MGIGNDRAIFASLQQFNSRKNLTGTKRFKQSKSRIDDQAPGPKVCSPILNTHREDPANPINSPDLTVAEKILLQTFLKVLNPHKSTTSIKDCRFSNMTIDLGKAIDNALPMLFKWAQLENKEPSQSRGPADQRCQTRPCWGELIDSFEGVTKAFIGAARAAQVYLPAEENVIAVIAVIGNKTQAKNLQVLIKNITALGVEVEGGGGVDGGGVDGGGGGNKGAGGSPSRWCKWFGVGCRWRAGPPSPLDQDFQIHPPYYLLNL